MNFREFLEESTFLDLRELLHKIGFRKDRKGGWKIELNGTSESAFKELSTSKYLELQNYYDFSSKKISNSKTIIKGKFKSLPDLEMIQEDGFVIVRIEINHSFKDSKEIV